MRASPTRTHIPTPLKHMSCTPRHPHPSTVVPLMSTSTLGVTMMMLVLGTASMVTAGRLKAHAPPPPKPAAEIAPYPPMHWHSWNTFYGENRVNESNMREMADALISTGMVAAGYDMVNVVCNGWTGRDPKTGVLQENKTYWPNGIAGYADYVHSKGLKLGCYTSPATTNCCGEPGSLGYEMIDMEFFATSGCDHVMVDWCHAYVNPEQTRAEYDVIGQAIANSSNPNMLYGIWPGGMGKSWKWGADVGGHYWRTAADIMNTWGTGLSGNGGSVLHNFDVAYSIPDIASHTVPGHYTFLDQMVVGVDPSKPGGVAGPGLNMEETRSHMTMWVMAASPLLTCNDVRDMNDSIKEILTNPEVLAVHKDPLTKMAVRIDVGGGVEEDHASDLCGSATSMYGKDLADGSSAVMVLNRGDVNATVTVKFEDVGDSMATHYAIRDLWQHANVTSNGGGGVEVTVAPHGVRLLRMWPIAPPPPPACPSGFDAHPGGYWYNTDPCPNNNFNNCTEDRENATITKCAAKCVAADDCVAFEMFMIDVPVSDWACYIFLHTLQAPFTANDGGMTCVRATHTHTNDRALMK
eukprot:m.89557 g.89557  ORF g.89557 m.89557 type:complete len:579 (+) comp9808_c0_seq1:91-1827(+)